MKFLKCSCLIFLFLILFTAMPVLESESDESDSVTVPIIMYHKILKNTSGEFTIRPSDFEKDLKYLTDKEYHTVGVSDLIHYVYNGTPLPKNPILLTFDDGYYNNYVYALPLLEKYKKKIIVSVIGEDTEKWSTHGYDDLRYGHVTWDQVRDMVKTGNVEIANHTYMLHKKALGRNGCCRKKGEPLSQYKNIFQNDLNKLQSAMKEKSGVVPESFTYPYQSVSPESINLLKDVGIKAAFTIHGGLNKITIHHPDSLLNLKRTNRSSKMSVEKILDKINQVKSR